MKYVSSLFAVGTIVLSFVFTGCQTSPSSGQSDTADIGVPLRQADAVFESDQLEASKTILERGQVGGRVVYRIAVKALEDVKNVRVSETLPAGVRFISSEPAATRTGNRVEWLFASMESGRERRIDVTVEPLREGDHHICSTVTIDNDFCFHFFAGQPKLEVTKRGPSQIELGEVATWTVTVSNRGSAEAVDVVVTDQFPDAFEPMDPLRRNIGALAPGESREVTYRAKAVRTGVFGNRATAGFAGRPPEETSTSSVPAQVVQSGLRIRKSGPEQAYVFKPERFEITVENTGDTDLKNVRITDLLPENSLIADPGKGRVGDNAIGWMIPHLPVGSSQLIATEVASTRPGTSTGMVKVHTAGGLEAFDTATTEWRAVPGVTVSITDGKDPIREGEPTVYRIRVRNQGDFEPVSGMVMVTFTEPLRPTGIEGDGQGTINEQTVTFPRTTLEPGKDIHLRVTAEGARIGSGRAVLEFSADFLNQPVISEETTNVY